jgi:hypothetical protein
MRQSRSSGSAEGVMGNHGPYSDTTIHHTYGTGRYHSLMGQVRILS